MSGLWGGRFEGRPDPRFAAFNQSLGCDGRLWREDLDGSAAWARALRGAGVLSADEAQQLLRAIEELRAELERDQSALLAAEDEDIHAFVEARLERRVGALARKLHTGRSRNDQVATDLKLWMRGAIGALEAALADLATALVELADGAVATALPGYTHLQRAQPVTAGHHALAYVEMLARDRARLRDCAARLDTCPLGSGALAGCAWPVDREALATSLGFAAPTRNSLDAVGDRDHVAELLFVCSLIGVHLSRLAEDWIFFASQEAGLLELSDAVATGSSLMPQKKNPDALELIRGKSGRLIGRLTGLLATLKGLPLAYDKDLQEDKPALFDGVDETLACLGVAAIVARNARYRSERCRAAAASGCLNATDLADLLVRRGVPFRDAHERSGAAVRAALERGVELEQLPAEARAALLPELSDLSADELSAALSVEAGLERRATVGGTAPERVRAEVTAWKRRLIEWNTRS